MASAETSVTSDTGGYAGEEETVTISLVEDRDEVVNLIGDGDKEAPDATEAESLRPPPPPALLSHPLLQPAGLLWNAGIPCCVISSLFFSVNAVVVKSLQDLPVFQIALARSVVSIVTTLGLVRPTPKHSLFFSQTAQPTPSLPRQIASRRACSSISTRLYSGTRQAQVECVANVSQPRFLRAKRHSEITQLCASLSLTRQRIGRRRRPQPPSSASLCSP
jgi:hypothetical protein